LPKSAFTLAETLIVIGIIGVVAALTLPNLNHATGDKEKVTKVKKIYSALTDAVDRAQVIYGDFDTWFTDLEGEEDLASRNERAAKRITEFMKVSKDCGFDEGCFSNAPLLVIDGSEYFENYLESLKNVNAYMITLSDGMSLRFESFSLEKFKIGVDIDGPNKGKNQEGNDIFDFAIYLGENYANVDGAKTNILYPSARPGELTGNYPADGEGGSNYSTAWVIENGNLDYLKCPDDLNWETQTSCK